MADRDFSKQLLKMLVKSMSSPSFYDSLGSDTGDGVSYFGDMPSSQITEAPGQLAGIAPLLQAVGIQLPDMLLQNFHMLPRQGGSALFESMIGQNTRNYGQLGAMLREMQGARAASLFGPESVLGRIMPEMSGFMYRGYLGAGSGFENGVGQFTAPILNQFLTKLTGYDVGGSINLLNARSMGMATGMRSLYGGPFGQGRDVGSALQDILDREFENTRTSASTLAFSAAQGLTWDIDEGGTIHGRNKNAHGASELLVGDILSEVIQSGALDREFRDAFRDEARTARMKEVASTLPIGGPFSVIQKKIDDGTLSFSDLESAQEEMLSRRGTILSRINDLQRQKAENEVEINDLVAQSEKLSGESPENKSAKEKNEKAIEDAKSKIKDFDDNIASLTVDLRNLTDSVSDIGKLVKEGGANLVGAVTATVDSLKDLYGDETKAAKALRMLTGGEGITNSAVAQSIKRAVDEYKVTAMAAGMDPQKAGAYLKKNLEQITSQWGSDAINGTAAVGQLALGMANMAVRGAAGIRDEAERQRYVEAESAIAGEVGNSEGFRARAMYQYMLENRDQYFSGREDLENRIATLMQSTDPADFFRAKRLIQSTFGRGSIGVGEEIFNSPQAMARIINDLSPEGARDVAEWATGKNADEIRRLKDDARRQDRESRAATALLEAGWSRSDVDTIVTRADTRAVMGKFENGQWQGGKLDELLNEAIAKEAEQDPERLEALRSRQRAYDEAVAKRDRHEELVRRQSQGEQLSEAETAELASTELTSDEDKLVKSGGLTDDEQAELKASDDRKSRIKRITTALERWQQTYKAELERGGNEVEAQRAANRVVVSSGLLTEDERRQVLNLSTDTRVEDLKNAWGLDNGSVNGNALSDKFKEVMRGAGAVGSSGALTGETFGIVKERSFRALSDTSTNGTFYKNDGSVLTYDELEGAKKEIDNLIKSGDTAGAVARFDALVSSINESGRTHLAAILRDAGAYNTPESAAAARTLSARDRENMARAQEDRDAALKSIAGYKVSVETEDGEGKKTSEVDLVENGRVNDDAFKALKDQYAELDKEYGLSADEEWQRLTAKQVTYEKLKGSSESRQKAIDEYNKILASKESTPEQKLMARTELGKLKREQETYNTLEAELVEGGGLKRIEALDEQLHGESSVEGKAKLQSVTTALRVADRVRNDQRAIDALNEKKSNGTTVDEEAIANIGVANTVANVSPDATYSVSERAYQRNGVALTEAQYEPIRQRVERAEEQGLSAQEGLGQKLLNFLTGMDTAAFAQSVAGSTEALRQFETAIMNMLKELNIDVQNRDAQGGSVADEAGGAGGAGGAVGAGGAGGAGGADVAGGSGRATAASTNRGSEDSEKSWLSLAGEVVMGAVSTSLSNLFSPFITGVSPAGMLRNRKANSSHQDTDTDVSLVTPSTPEEPGVITPDSTDTQVALSESDTSHVVESGPSGEVSPQGASFERMETLLASNTEGLKELSSTLSETNRLRAQPGGASVVVAQG